MTDTVNRFHTFEQTKYFPSLDGLRAFCVFAVFFAHMHERLPPAFYGWLGVDVFFVLSGFLITTLMVREHQRSGRISLKAFYTRRFFRIVPVYLFAVLIYGVAVQAVHDPLKIQQFKIALPWLLGFLQEYRPAAAGNVLGHAWTLGVEEKFYVLWPLLVVLLYPFRAWRLALLGVLFSAVVISPFFYRRSYGAILLGAFLALALSLPSLQSIAARLPRISNPFLWIFFAVSYYLTGVDARFSLLFALAAVGIVASLVLRESLSRRFLTHPVLVYVGKRSYVIYLLHVLAIDTVETYLTRFFPTHTRNWVEVIVLSFSASLACAALIHAFIENPCIDFGRRISRRFTPSNPAPGTLPATHSM